MNLEKARVWIPAALPLCSMILFVCIFHEEEQKRDRSQRGGLAQRSALLLNTVLGKAYVSLTRCGCRAYYGGLEVEMMDIDERNKY